jgi:cytochrome c oxidase subunit 4
MAESSPSISPTAYYATYGGLVALTVATVGASFFELGWWHIAAGLLFGAAKAILVALIFMHLVRAGKTIWIVAGAGLFWLAILFVLTLSDYWARYWGVY